jgi:cephalosporin hydroxylase
MFPLWDVAIAPVLQAARAARVVEIGALRGETTIRMLESLGPDAELHVIDPVPDFDPAEHQRQFPGRYYFHQALSLEVLPTLGPVDAALIDGDHNWFTVYHELKMLAEASRSAGAELPVIVMHDVLWPYGRRDLYYAPEDVPEEFRQPYAQGGMKPGQKLLAAKGGLNPKMFNAEVEGGPRNGVMTALDDFEAEYDRPLRRLVLPIYFGLAFAVEEARLERQPELAAALDRLESAEGRFELLEVSEEVRLRAMIFQHNVHFQRAERVERATARYLKTVKASLLNEHYLDHELRMEQLAGRILAGRAIQPEQLRDPARNDQIPFRQLMAQRTGPGGPDDAGAASFLPYTTMGRTSLDHLEQCLDAVREESIPGDLAECGTGRGGGAIFLRAYLDGHEDADREVWVADRFRSSPEPLKAPEMPKNGVAGFRADLNLVRDGFARFDLLDERVHFLQGEMEATLPDAPIEQLALLRIGRDAGDQIRTVLDQLYDRVSDGGFVVVDVGGDASRREQVEAFRRDRGIGSQLERVGSSGLSWRRSATDTTAPAQTAPTIAARAPMAPVTPTGPVDLTVVVVFYNMRREAERTLHSLSRAYQQELGDATYEVIAIENGSDESQKLGAEFVASFGPEFRYIDMGEDATPSPTPALNRGIRAGRGKNFALMIDGAHVLTPGVLRFGLAGLQTYDHSIVATQQWYVGPGQQGDAMDNGYDQEYEDRLFQRINWPHAGYRLFEISHFIGDRDWFDGLWESNCMFVTRAQLRQVGGFDESFSMPGGGYANLELYERLGSSPDISVTTIIGEGSFHQSHGGTTTNQIDPEERRGRVFGYGQHFAETRGRAFRGPGKPIHYVGRISTEAARRSKPRRLSTRIFAEGAAAGLHDGRPDAPIPVPDELKWAFTESVWRNLPWNATTWLGRRITTAPTDLLAYQELIATIRPDWIIEAGDGDDGRTLFFASICDLVDHGQVISINPERDDGAELVKHARVTQVVGDAADPEIVEQVRAAVGDAGRVLVVLGASAPRDVTVKMFNAYAPLVPVDSYVVVTDTIVNGHPVWPAFGAGPAEAVKQILTKHGEFVHDPAMEKYSLTFNPGGFLRRVR